MAFDEDGQLKAIAAEWEVDPGLLEEVDWELESIDSNEGVTVGYFVRFSEDTDRGVLDQLGVTPGEFYRELSMNAFDQPDEPDDGTFSVNEPFPDISSLISEDFDFAEPAERSNYGRRAYFIDDERFTPSRFRRLSRRRKVEAMVPRELRRPRRSNALFERGRRLPMDLGWPV